MVCTNEFKQFKTFARELIAQGDFVWLEWNQNPSTTMQFRQIGMGGVKIQILEFQKITFF